MNQSASTELGDIPVPAGEPGDGGSVVVGSAPEAPGLVSPDGMGPIGQGDAIGLMGAGDGVSPVVEGDVIVAVEHELTVLLRRARAVSKDFARLVHPELESDAYGLLIRLAEVGGARGTDLAAYFGIGKPTISRQVKELEELGLVERQAQAGDARASVLVLTEDGKARFHRMREARQERFRSLLADWDPSDKEQFATLLHRWNTSTSEPR